jgi:hypothetical protein
MLLPLLTMAGCYSYRPIEVLVLNGNDDQPLSGVELGTDCAIDYTDPIHPIADKKSTDSSGTARLKVCINDRNIRSGKVPIYMLDENYLFDELNAAAFVLVPVDKIKAASTDRPYEITVHVLRRQDYAQKYHVRFQGDK